MNLKKVPLYLQEQAQIAINDNQYRYDRIERYALKKVLAAAKNNEAIDSVFIKSAINALKNHSADHQQYAAA